MKTVLLVNHAIGMSRQLQPVCGKSGKLYGNAQIEAGYSAPVLRMPYSQWIDAARDICANTGAGQQWTPYFMDDYQGIETLTGIKISIDAQLEILTIDGVPITLSWFKEFLFQKPTDSTLWFRPTGPDADGKIGFEAQHFDGKVSGQKKKTTARRVGHGKRHSSRVRS